ncbi:hypothetical protein A3A36_01180 [Candidatus Kaiserbacteria bacterium RIFCSPLOWO2_01_FULL_52_12b]|uniref:Uncharacterized protein n=1 Tax=Candidatus Kaiserbacteria bacterium RIFCSPLOWO2_01_FULL_52_12b TaxID=1798509 RepID=A0A1F6EWX6_9BACT|nr:MAG: hypothetical protein A3A36_01180 [Candidatus Kaiserbacteria bacterium RIFCSPLOWO2_01_FULL_52_12b]
MKVKSFVSVAHCEGRVEGAMKFLDNQVAAEIPRDAKIHSVTDTYYDPPSMAACIVRVVLYDDNLP